MSEINLTLHGTPRIGYVKDGNQTKPVLIIDSLTSLMQPLMPEQNLDKIGNRE